MRIKVIIPFPMDEAGVSLREAQLPPGARGSIEEITFSPVRNSGLLADSHYESVLIDCYVTAEGVHAEEEGFDAVVIDTVSDAGLEALRSRLQIPVVGPGQTSLHIAAMLGHRFSILSIWKGWEFTYRRSLRRYAMEDRLASIRSLDKVPDVRSLLSDDPETIDELVEAAAQAVREDEADVLIMGSTTMYQAIPAIADAVDVPVINPGLWAVLIAADCVRCGISHSKRAYAPPLTLQDEVFDRMPPRDDR
jgi:Asp/Glu/hydantoin racemase